jgi:hypothetical protein
VQDVSWATNLDSLLLPLKSVTAGHMVACLKRVYLSFPTLAFDKRSLTVLT